MKSGLGRKLLSAAVLASSLSALVPAQAGLVVSTWDPLFGSFLPNLSWQVRAELIVPQACLNQADGIYSTTGGACDIGGITVQTVSLRLFDTVTPGNVFTWAMNTGPGYGVSQVRLVGGQLAGFEAGRADLLPSILTPAFAQTVVSGDFDNNPLTPDTTESWPSSAEGNLFGLTFGVNGPVLECHQCRAHFADPQGIESIYADNTGLQQLFITYQDNQGTIPTVSDPNGAPLGVRLDDHGRVLGSSATIDGPVQNLRTANVPLPSVPALLLAAGLAGWATRRRRG